LAGIIQTLQRFCTSFYKLSAGGFVITKTIAQSNKDLLARSQVQNQQSLVAAERWV
jgi:prephenate dehydrogenase